MVLADGSGPSSLGPRILALRRRCRMERRDPPASPAEWLPASVGESLLRYFMIAVTIIVVAVPEGLADERHARLAYSMRKMTAANNLVRQVARLRDDRRGDGHLLGQDRHADAEHRCELQVRDVPAHDGRRSPSRDRDWQPACVVEGIAANSTANLSQTKQGGRSRPRATRPKARCCCGWKSKASTTSCTATRSAAVDQLTSRPSGSTWDTLGRSAGDRVAPAARQGRAGSLLLRAAHTL